jgi:hypothetical protein
VSGTVRFHHAISEFIMTEDIHFLRETVVDIDAAVVGVSSARWTAIPETEATAERAAENNEG